MTPPEVLERIEELSLENANEASAIELSAEQEPSFFRTLACSNVGLFIRHIRTYVIYPSFRQQPQTFQAKRQVGWRSTQLARQSKHDLADILAYTIHLPDCVPCNCFR